MPKRKQVQKKNKNQSNTTTKSTKTVIGDPTIVNDQQQDNPTHVASYSTYTTFGKKKKGRRQGKGEKDKIINKNGFTFSNPWNISWIVGMILVSAFVAIASVVVARTARGVVPPSSDPEKIGINSDDDDKNQMGGSGNTDNGNNPNSHQLPFASFDGVAEITNQYRIVNTYDHDTSSFTQGLLVHDGTLIESTGMYGDSLVRRWDPASSTVLTQNSDIDAKYFGEGITWYIDEKGNERLVMLTWREQTAFVFDPNTLEVLKTFEYTTHTNEGWGITFDPQQKVFYVSDGSQYIHIWNLQFEEINRFPVSVTLPTSTSRPNGDAEVKTSPLNYLNELEWDASTGTILANVLMQNAIVQIIPHSGKVAKVYDLSTLYTNRTPKSDVLNGIAKHPTLPNHWWITGKYWPNIYLLEMV